MGVTTENIAEKFEISRDEQDNFALNFKKTQDASNKKFQDEIIKLQINKEKENLIFDKDEHPRNDLEIDDLKKLKTVLKKMELLLWKFIRYK